MEFSKSVASMGSPAQFKLSSVERLLSVRLAAEAKLLLKTNTKDRLHSQDSERK